MNSGFGKCWRSFGLALAAIALLAAPSSGANQGDALKLGLANTINLSTSLSGNTPAPQLFVSNTNAGANGAIKGQSSSAVANAFSVYGLLTATAPAGTSAAVRGENKGTNANGYGVWGSHAGGGVGVYGTAATGIAVYGKHTGGGTAAAVRGDSASTAASAFALYGLLSSTGPGGGSAAVRGENKGTNAGGYGVWGSQAGAGTGVYGSSANGRGVYGQGGSIGVIGQGSSAGILGRSTTGWGMQGQSTDGYGVEGGSTNSLGVFGSSSSSDGVAGSGQTSGVHGESPTIGVKGVSAGGIGVRGESTNFQGVSGSSVHNAGVYGETTGDGFASYFVGRTEQHGALNVYASTASVSNGSVRIARDTSTFSGTGAALQAEHGGTNGEAAWFRIMTNFNQNAVLMLVRPSLTGDFMRCYQKGFQEGDVCHIDGGGTFVSGSDFAESLRTEGAKAKYEPGDVLSMSTAHPGEVVKARHPRDRTLIGVYSTRPAVLGADKGGVTRVGKNEVPVAITGIVPVKATAANGPIRVGDLLTSSSLPGRAMNAGRTPAVGTVLGKAMGALERGAGTIRMLVMPR
jgi:hypothetical protein